MDNGTHISIKDWSEDDQPREKLLYKGKNALSDAELLAILIGSGSRNESAVDLCKRILQQNNNQLHQLAKQSIQQLMQFKGIGEAKAITIVAALELSKRLQLSDVKELTKIGSSADVCKLMQPIIGDLPHEEFWCLLLNNSNKVIYKFQLSKGGLTQTVVDVRMLFKTALEHLATALILVHNHPSGQLSPSTADKDITFKIQEAGKSLDIKLLDHLIITQTSYVSFADEGLV
ncbi:DNA repair protein RadC [Flavobacterium sp. xlx-214]|uniref:RadC family protein n=1 Tax=unclassified Flavobacterium TaxID=196869 RepID=UPI0013CFD272|nr:MULTISPECIES: DNA repair protein RadC [unclassified Flavobacterium]MBA5792724.1 DNA repair protein RadC [Flavobacterium sp. xlx-221]QMI83865.1 DNA repair protein RadC [Flavobacterium sp. xlx-214]